MIIYNVTIKVAIEIAADWRQWMLKEHIPMLMNLGCFVDAKFYRLLEQDDTEGPTFCAQYFCNSMAEYERYISDYALEMRKETLSRWGNKLVAYRSVLQSQDE